jgi:hypothetical protein
MLINTIHAKSATWLALYELLRRTMIWSLDSDPKLKVSLQLMCFMFSSIFSERLPYKEVGFSYYTTGDSLDTSHTTLITHHSWISPLGTSFQTPQRGSQPPAIPQLKAQWHGRYKHVHPDSSLEQCPQSRWSPLANFLPNTINQRHKTTELKWEWSCEGEAELTVVDLD